MRGHLLDQTGTHRQGAIALARHCKAVCAHAPVDASVQDYYQYRECFVICKDTPLKH